MSSAAVGTHSSGAGPLSLMSCVRESSPLQDYESPDTEKNAATKKKFWNPKKWFKRKNKATEDVVIPVEITEKDVLRSRSTSELSIDQEQQTRRRSGSSMHPGLSVSHDSVFHSPNSGSDLDLDAAQSSSSLSISQPQIDLRLQTELSERLRLRRGRGDTSEDDEGLPHSPCNSPTTTDALLLDKTAIIKDLPTKSHSTCSDGSLLSMGSSEMDEDSFGQQSRHSSKLSLHEKRSSDQDSDLELGSSTTPLNHSAAHHRVAVRPKRRAPHRNRVPQLSTALPTTPEVNEESSIRSITPESASREAVVTELYSMSTSKTTTTTTLTESQLKCSSLPPGLAAPGAAAIADNNKLNRSRSNAGSSKSQDHFATLEEDVEKEEKTDKSFFDRIFPRRSGKKRKSKEEKTTTVTTTSSKQMSVETSTTTRSRMESKPIAAPRSGAAARQRIQPIDLPPSPEALSREFECILPKPSPEKSYAAGTSPLQAELENRFKQQRQTLMNNASLTTTPPQSPKSPPPRNFVDSSVISSSRVEIKRESIRNEEIKSKMKIPPGLSSLQQRVLSLGDEDDDEVDDAGSGFKSLTDLPDDDDEIKTVKPVTKSHSFKSVKAENKFVIHNKTNEMMMTSEKRISMCKAASLDSVKHLEELGVKQFLEKEKKALVDDEESVSMEQEQEKEEHFSEVRNEVLMEDDELKIREDLTNKMKDFLPSDVMNNITISGPSHTAVVNVSSNTMDTYDLGNTTKTETLTSGDRVKEVTTKESVSVTKIQVKRESTQITQSTVQVPKNAVPEFFNRQLNKVEAKPASNVVFSMNSPRIIDEQSRPKTVFTEQEKSRQFPRKFSQDEIEIVEMMKMNDEEVEKVVTPMITVIPMTVVQPRFKKNDNSKRKSSITSPESPKSEKPFPRSRSISLDSLKSGDAAGESSDKSSQDSLDKLDEEETPTKSSSTAAESVVLRKKSLIKQKNEEEPELMKVFARRSLKLKDTETETVSQQVNAMLDNDSKTKDSSDKENQADSPKEERKKSIVMKLKEPLNESKVIKKEEILENRENLITETIKTPPTIIKEQPKIKDSVERKFIETAEVTLRKPNNNNFYTRAFSVNPPKSCEQTTATDMMKVKKQASFCERRKTDNWISTNIKNGSGGGDDLIERKISQDEFITGISPKSGDYISTAELITETKNFNQRKAEWEKRAQEAQKKSVP